MTDNDTETAAPHQAGPSSFEQAVKGLCPRCGARTLFDGPIKFRDTCAACGLDFTAYNVGDGPAAFLTFGIGALVTALAIGTDLTLHPPLWLHAILWLPLTFVSVVVSLRAAKAWLLAAEYRNAAREGRLKDDA